MRLARYPDALSTRRRRRHTSMLAHQHVRHFRTQTSLRSPGQPGPGLPKSKLAPPTLRAWVAFGEQLSSSASAPTLLMNVHMPTPPICRMPPRVVARRPPPPMYRVPPRTGRHRTPPRRPSRRAPMDLSAQHHRAREELVRTALHAVKQLSPHPRLEVGRFHTQTTKSQRMQLRAPVPPASCSPPRSPPGATEQVRRTTALRRSLSEATIVSHVTNRDDVGGDDLVAALGSMAVTRARSVARAGVGYDGELQLWELLAGPTRGQTPGSPSRARSTPGPASSPTRPVAQDMTQGRAQATLSDALQSWSDRDQQRAGGSRKNWWDEGA
jgi:hypothetical protein